MAFKQVRHRSSLFRPWAFGDNHPLKQQKEETVSHLASLPERPDLNELLKDNYRHENANQQTSKVVQGPTFNVQKDLTTPSAFKATSVRSRNSLPVPEQTLDFQTTLINSPPVLNLLPEITSLPHIPPPPEPSLLHPGLDMKSNTHIPCPWELPTELSYPVSSSISQLLDPPSTSKWKTKKQRPKRFQCPHCQVSFSNNGQLRGHIRIHTGERPFACEHPECGKTFTRNEELTRHKRIHSGVRPHSCLLCGKRFGRKDHLKKHVKTHQRASLVRMPITAFHGLTYFDCVPWF